MKTFIEVLQIDIEDGVRGDCDACPVARAVNRAIGRDLATVGTDSIQIGLCIMTTPHRVSRWINRFDGNWVSSPFSFELDIPDECFRRQVPK